MREVSWLANCDPMVFALADFRPLSPPLGVPLGPTAEAPSVGSRAKSYSEEERNDELEFDNNVLGSTTTNRLTPHLLYELNLGGPGHSKKRLGGAVAVLFYKARNIVFHRAGEVPD